MQAMFKCKTPLLPRTARQINANTLEQRAKVAGQKAQTAECTGKHNLGYKIVSTSLATAKLKQFCSQSSWRTMTQSTFFTQESIKNLYEVIQFTPLTELLHTPTKEKLQVQQLWTHWAVRTHTISTKNLVCIHDMSGLYYYSQLHLCND